jgi:hypothetical protein
MNPHRIYKAKLYSPHLGMNKMAQRETKPEKTSIDQNLHSDSIYTDSKDHDTYSQ